MLRVLIIDDDPDVADSMFMLIEALGYDARAVKNGSEALSELATYSPHVALIDIEMPGMDGWETARRIRERPEGVNMLLVAITGYGQVEDKLKSQEAGFDHHIVKPVDGVELGSFLDAIGRSLLKQ